MKQLDIWISFDYDNTPDQYLIDFRADGMEMRPVTYCTFNEWDMYYNLQEPIDIYSYLYDLYKVMVF